MMGRKFSLQKEGFFLNDCSFWKHQYSYVLGKLLKLLKWKQKISPSLLQETLFLNVSIPGYRVHMSGQAWSSLSVSSSYEFTSESLQTPKLQNTARIGRCFAIALACTMFQETKVAKSINL